MLNVLELFSGTQSVGKICKDLSYNVISIDIENEPTHKVDILEWDYKIYPKDYFYYIHSSPPCETFSNIRKCWFGRKIKAHDGIFTKELYLQDQLEFGVPLLNKTLEIIEYFSPKYYTIENPQSGEMKNYLTHLPSTNCDYCRYGFDYKKPTTIWNNFSFKGKKCIHQKVKYSHTKRISKRGKTTLNERYQIPESLVRDWLNCFVD